MKMVIGGAASGKIRYASKKYEIDNWTDGDICRAEDIFRANAICSFHRYIYRRMLEGNSCDALASELIARNPSIIIVSDEIGCGVVPADAFERRYREQVGRVCIELADFSKEVCRVYSGIGVVIKGG